MKLMNLVDTEGRHFSVNPFGVAGLREDDAGCVLYRGRDDPPITLNETVEVMCDALSSYGVNSERIAAVKLGKATAHLN